MESAIEVLQKDIQIINTFAGDFLKKTKDIEITVKNASEKLDKMIELEKANQKFIADINEKLSEKSLDTLLSVMEEGIKIISAKRSQYLSIVESNHKNIQYIKDVIENQKEKLKILYSVRDNLDKHLQ